MRYLVWVGMVMFVAACGKPSLEAACRRQVDVTCARLFECNRAGAEFLYGSQANCVTQTSAVCEPYKGYTCDDLSAYERCISDQGSAACGTTVTCGPTSQGTNCMKQ